jgi:hypothetical protein
MMPQFGLGRRFAPDDRDKKYPVSLLMTEARRAEIVGKTYRYWNANGWWGDQGQTPMCVGYGWAHWIEDGPVTHGGRPPILAPDVIYHEAQKVDEWPGENYEGTSVRAGAKVLQARGFISAYHWTTKLQELLDTLLGLGPVTVGTNWYDGMFSPDEAGLIKVAGSLAGGHCFKLDGANLDHELIRIKNSWGRSWGNNGFAYISFKDMDRLIGEDGEVCLGVEAKV